MHNSHAPQRKKYKLKTNEYKQNKLPTTVELLATSDSDVERDHLKETHRDFKFNRTQHNTKHYYSIVKKTLYYKTSFFLIERERKQIMFQYIRYSLRCLVEVKNMVRSFL